MTVQSGNGGKWWFNGLPFQTVAQSKTSGTQKYWFNGLPIAPHFTGGSAASILAAGTGALILTGVNAGLIYTLPGVGYVLPAANGTITLSGKNVNFLLGIPNAYTMHADWGEFLLVRGFAGLKVTALYPVEAQPGKIEFGRKVILHRW